MNLFNNIKYKCVLASNLVASRENDYLVGMGKVKVFNEN